VTDDTPEPQTVEMQVPGLAIEPPHGTQVKVIPHPGDPTVRAIVIGPILLHIAIPLSEEAANEVAAELTKTHVLQVPATALSSLPAMAVPGSKR
jgi:hypothetical protein